jgi:hypothetical protein
MMVTASLSRPRLKFFRFPEGGRNHRRSGECQERVKIVRGCGSRMPGWVEFGVVFPYQWPAIEIFGSSSGMSANRSCDLRS